MTNLTQMIELQSLVDLAIHQSVGNAMHQFRFAGFGNLPLGIAIGVNMAEPEPAGPWLIRACNKRPESCLPRTASFFYRSLRRDLSCRAPALVMRVAQISCVWPLMTILYRTGERLKLEPNWLFMQDIPKCQPSIIMAVTQASGVMGAMTARHATDLHTQPLHRLKRYAWARSGVAPRLTRVSKTLPSHKSIAQL